MNWWWSANCGVRTCEDDIEPWNPSNLWHAQCSELTTNVTAFFTFATLSKAASFVVALRSFLSFDRLEKKSAKNFESSPISPHLSGISCHFMDATCLPWLPAPCSHSLQLACRQAAAHGTLAHADTLRCFSISEPMLSKKGLEQSNMFFKKCSLKISATAPEYFLRLTSTSLVFPQRSSPSPTKLRASDPFSHYPPTVIPLQALNSQTKLCADAKPTELEQREMLTPTDGETKKNVRCTYMPTWQVDMKSLFLEIYIMRTLLRFSCLIGGICLKKNHWCFVHGKFQNDSQHVQLQSPHPPKQASQRTCAL